MPITIHSAQDIAGMRVAGRLASEVLDFITPYVRAGITTGELDQLCHDYIVGVQHAIPACLNHAGQALFPKAVCISINDQACYGIPGKQSLFDGDIVNVDVTIIKDGYRGDTSRMYSVGVVPFEASVLCAVAQECMWLGIEKIKPGAHAADIGFAIAKHAQKRGVSVVPDVHGQDVGKKFHDERVPAIARPDKQGRLEPGMIFSIEPIINAGGPEICRLDDGWATADGSFSAKWEHTVLVTESGYEVLTRFAH